MAHERAGADDRDGDPDGAHRAAAAGSEGAFERLVSPFRRELHVHCYRMLGSVHDADDALQETLLRAWRMLGGFEGRSSLRAWLYRIATNVCLTALAQRRRPTVAVPPGLPPGRPGEPLSLAPYPDAFLADVVEPAAGPEQLAVQRDAVELAFVAAVQLLPPRQRAVLVLRDVLAFSAVETAEALEMSTPAVTSALHRARTTLAAAQARAPLGPSHRTRTSAEERALVRRFVEAWRAGDVDRLVALFAHDAVLSMPPVPVRYVGRLEIARFLREGPLQGRLEAVTLVETRAHGRPGFAAYVPDGQGGQAPFGVMLLSVGDGRITGLVGFTEPGVVEPFERPTDGFPVRVS